jgi:hypothetical protein
MRKCIRAVMVALFLSVGVTGPAVHARSLKPPCRQSLADCPNEGCGGDTGLNQLKNQTDPATDASDWTVADILDLEVPHVGQNEPRVASEELGEGSAIRVSGYLIRGDTTKTPEACNCYLRGPDNNDLHLNVVEHKKDDIGASVIVEITPRVRPRGWDLVKIKTLANRGAYLRLTGWLLLDTMHTGESRGRGTPWEVHPVTECEVCTKSVSQCDQGKGWIPLATYEP